MDAKKILFIAQEITPYLPESEIATICRNLPQGIQERGREIRTFMPKFGNINERRNQLHEVIRLFTLLTTRISSNGNPRSAIRMEMSMKIMTIVRSSMYAEYWKP